jgi:flagellar hook-basal body complex protein FliE
MNRLISAFKRTNLFRVVTVFLAGVLVFFTTACSGGAQAKAMDQNPRPEVPGGAVTSPYQGGMNDFSDVDPRADVSGANKKAEALINRAEHNIDQATGNPAKVIKRAVGDAPEAGKNLGQRADDIGNKAKDSAEDFAQGTKRGIENIKGNTQNAANEAPKTFDQAKRNAGNTAEDTANAVDKIKDTFQGAVQGITGNAKNSVDKASTSLKTGAEQAVENSKQAFGNNPERID